MIWPTTSATSCVHLAIKVSCESQPSKLEVLDNNCATKIYTVSQKRLVQQPAEDKVGNVVWVL